MYSKRFGIHENSRKDISVARRGSGNGVVINGINARIYNVFIIFHAAPKSPLAAPATMDAVIIAWELPYVAALSFYAYCFSKSEIPSSSLTSLRSPSK